MPGNETPSINAPPRVSPFLIRYFTRYTRRFLAKNFHGVRLSRGDGRPGVPAESPLVIYANHPSWWDPMIGIFLTRELFSGRTLYAPIDDEALAKYKFFAKLGFFGIDRAHGVRGAGQFLKAVRAILASPNAVLWLTPQGHFTDARQRPVTFEPGIAHVANRIPGVTFLPIAIEYVFWEERTPELLIRFGEPAHSGPETGLDTDAWRALLQNRLEETQDALAAESMGRDPAAFELLLEGRAGVNFIYDFWRAAKAKWRGESFDRKHGGK